MQVVAYNQQQLDVIIRDMYNDFNEYKSLAISYDKPFKDKTIRQLGYFFGSWNISQKRSFWNRDLIEI